MIIKQGVPKILIKDLIIGYHTWFSKDILIASILEDGGLSLVISDIVKGTNQTVQRKVGQSLHKIPTTQLISYISKETKKWEIKSLDPITGITKKIINTVTKAEDMCWLADGTILMPKDNIIYKFNPKTDAKWSVFHTFLDKEIWNISRITTNKTGTLLSLVSDVSPEHIIQKQLDAYNARDIDTFINTYSDTIKVYNYPNKLSYEGKKK